MVDFFKKNSIKNEEKGNGFRFKPKDIEQTANAITTLAGNRMDDDFLAIPEATKQGYSLAKDGDGV